MIEDFVVVFTQFITQATPYVIVWRIGEYIAATLINCMTGGARGKSGRLDI